MPVNEMHILANRFVEEFEDAITPMLACHRGEGVGEVLNQGEDHGSASSEKTFIVQPRLAYP